MLRTRDVMTKDVIWLRAGRSVEEAFKFMTEFSFRHLPVVDDQNKLVGILSEGDVLTSCNSINGQIILPNVKIEEIMTKDVITCSPNNPLGNVVATMMACKIDCVPVVSHQGLVGIVTTTDILDVYCRSEEDSGHSFMPYDFVERKHVVYGG